MYCSFNIPSGDYGNLSVLCATFSNVPVLAMTTTANKSDREDIKKSLGLKNCFEVVGNPDCRKMKYEKHFRAGPDIDSLTDILTLIVQDFLKEQVDYPLTIIYIPLKWCGFAYKIFESILGSRQYYPFEPMQIPENRLFAQFHSPQTKEMKNEILKQLVLSPKLRVVFATVALGMDIRGIRKIVHITPPYSIQAYSQETGRTGRDGKPAMAVLFYNKQDVVKNKPRMQDLTVREFCRNKDKCLRDFLLTSLDTDKKYFKPVSPKHPCCNVCKLTCHCTVCTSE